MERKISKTTIVVMNGDKHLEVW